MSSLLTQTLAPVKAVMEKNEEENNLIDEIMSRAGTEEKNSKDDAN